MRFNPFRKRKTPDQKGQDILAALGDDYPHTPDLGYLEWYEHVDLFVADEMMTGNRFHSLLQKNGVRRRATAYSERHFVMFKLQVQHMLMPIILRPRQAEVGALTFGTPAPLKGELYSVPIPVLRELDKYKQNGVGSNRIQVHLDIPYREIQEVDYITIQRDGPITLQKCRTGKVLGEWHHHRGFPAYTYVADTEHFFWGTYTEEYFKPAKLFKPADHNLKPYYHWIDAK